MNKMAMSDRKQSSVSMSGHVLRKNIIIGYIIF